MNVVTRLPQLVSKLLILNQNPYTDSSNYVKILALKDFKLASIFLYLYAN